MTEIYMIDGFKKMSSLGGPTLNKNSLNVQGENELDIKSKSTN